MPTPFSRTTRSLASDTSRFVLLSWLLGGVLLAGWLWWFFFSRITVYEISSKARIEVNYSAHPIASLVAGKIESITVGLGQDVPEGQILLTLDASHQKLALASEQSRLKAMPPQIDLLNQQIAALEQAKSKDRQAAQAAIDSARSRQKGAGAAEAFASDYAQRLAQLSSSGKTAVIETLRAKAESEKLNSAKQAIAADLQRIHNDAQAHEHQTQAEVDYLRRELAKLTGERDTLQTTIAELQQTIDQHVIRAPAAGQVGDLAPLQIGGYVEIGARLGSIVPRSDLKIVADFPPAAVVGRIRPGQTAQMRLDGFPWAQFGTLPAHVSRVGSEIRDNLVRVEFVPVLAANTQIILQHGLPGSIEVAIEQLSPALLVLRKSGQVLTVPHPSVGERKP